MLNKKDQSNAIGNYRTSTSKKEILQIINDASNQKQSILWQAFPDHRSIYLIKLIDMDYGKGLIKIFLDQNDDPINEAVPVYLKLAFRDSVFKGTIIDFSDKMVTLHIPEEIKTTELREYPRMLIEPKVEKFVVVAVVVNFVRNATSSLKVKLYDLSINGIGIIISDSNKKFFYKGSYAYLEFIETFKVEPKRLGEVIYLEPFQFRLEGKVEKGFKIGIKLIQPLTQNFINFVTKEMEGKVEQEEAKPSNLESIVLEDEFSKQIDEVIKTTMVRLKTNLSFKRILKELNINRDPSKYYQDHIVVLTKVVCSLAKLLNWITDATMEKLIYVCYIHDLGLMKHQHLARIRNLNELRAKGNTISEEEVKIYLNSPQVALDFWTNDKFGPEDADKLLIQQRELPDKSGFPKAIGSLKIAPLAALFIISHDFVDYVYHNQDWSLRSYLDYARPIFRGGYFTKIIESLELIKFKV